MAAQYRRVWMIDVRDSFFQSDPFAFVPYTPPAPASPSMSPGGISATSSFHVFNGVESFPIRECGWNSGWIKDCFGDGVLSRVGAKGIICSGVSAATTDAALDYIRTMNDIIMGQQDAQFPLDEELRGRFPTCERNGVDQGAHNVLVHSGALEHLHLRQWGQADGPVANMQARQAKIDCTGEGDDKQCTVRNKAGVVVAVVHQYDRYPELQQYLFKKV